MSINLNSVSECKIAYIEHLRCVKAGKPSPLSGKDLGDIERVYGDQTARWAEIANTSIDISDYVIDDDDYNAAVGRGKNETQKSVEDGTGFDGDKQHAKNRGWGDLGVQVTSAATTTIGAIGIAGRGIKAGAGAVKGTLKGNFGKAGAGSAFAYVAAALTIITATLYQVLKPNKKEFAALQQLQQKEFVESTQKLDDTVANMESTAEEVADLTDEANEKNDETQGDIVDEKANYDMLMRTYVALRQKADSGEPLTEQEKQLFDYVCTEMAKSGVNIEELQSKNADELQDLLGEIDDKQDCYDAAAENLGEVEGVTDYAENFDKTTQRMCYVEGAAQTTNALSGVVTAIQLLGLGFWNAVLAAATTAAAAISGVGAVEQFKMAGKIGDIIDARKDLQGMNNDTYEIYEDELENYGILRDGVGELELEVPDDVAAPDATLPPPTDTNVPEGTPDPVNPNNTADDDENPFKKPEDEE